MWLLLLALLIGGVYGYVAAGKQDKSQILWKGLLYGLILAVVVGLLAFFFGVSVLGLADLGFLGIMLNVLALTLAFILGVWIGDMIERRREPMAPRRV